jgi:hypothetical protein
VVVALLLVVQLVRRGGWGLLVLQGMLVVVEGERKMWVDHNTTRLCEEQGGIERVACGTACVVVKRHRDCVLGGLWDSIKSNVM